MTSYFFKFVTVEGADTGYVGLAVAPDLRLLFWEIDQYGDPMHCKVMTAARGSFCQNVHSVAHEYCDLPELDDPAWRDPKWPTDLYA